MFFQGGSSSGVSAFGLTQMGLWADFSIILVIIRMTDWVKKNENLCDR